MDEKYLKTTWKQRILVILIAVLLLGITITTYISIVLSGNKKSTSTDTADSAYEAQLQAKADEISAAATELSSQYLDAFSSYRGNVAGYNATTANDEGLQVADIIEGNGTEITEEWKDYYAYYIGYCADETVFDSSFDSFEEPTALSTPISGTMGLIDGWEQGIIGMKVGGVRQITIPGELAYKDEQEICGGTYSPLRFIIMAIEPGENFRKLMSEYEDIYAQYVAELYGTSN